MTIGSHKISLVPMALGIVTDAGHGVTHFRLFNLMKLSFTSWADFNGVNWVI